MSRNLAASIRARLKQRADATKQDFNLTLTHYGLAETDDAHHPPIGVERCFVQDAAKQRQWAAF